MTTLTDHQTHSTITASSPPQPEPVQVQPISFLKTSERENKPQAFFILTIVGTIVVIGVLGRFLWGFDGTTFLDRAMPTATTQAGALPDGVQVISQTVQIVTATPTVEPVFEEYAATPAPIVVEKIYTVTVPGEPQTVYLPIEVEKIVYVTNTVYIDVLPTPTPSVALGTGRICIYAEGVKAIYINDIGMAGNSCFELGQLATVNDWKIHIDR